MIQRSTNSHFSDHDLDLQTGITIKPLSHIAQFFIFFNIVDSQKTAKAKRIYRCLLNGSLKRFADVLHDVMHDDRF